MVSQRTWEPEIVGVNQWLTREVKPSINVTATIQGGVLTSEWHSLAPDHEISAGTKTRDIKR